MRLSQRMYKVSFISHYLHQRKPRQKLSYTSSLHFTFFFFAVFGVLIILFYTIPTDNLAKPLSFSSRSMKDIIKKQQLLTRAAVKHANWHSFICALWPPSSSLSPKGFCFCNSLVSGSLFPCCCLFQFFVSGIGSAWISFESSRRKAAQPVDVGVSPIVRQHNVRSPLIPR